jgi:hypothetical protein
MQGALALLDTRLTPILDVRLRCRALLHGTSDRSRTAGASGAECSGRAIRGGAAVSRLNGPCGTKLLSTVLQWPQ